MKKVILCTSQWDKLIDKTEGERRESQLLCEYWKKMMDDGARTTRHNTPESARQILELILGSNPVPLRIVTELKMEGVTLGDTSAGQESVENWIFQFKPRSDSDVSSRTNRPYSQFPAMGSCNPQNLKDTSMPNSPFKISPLRIQTHIVLRNYTNSSMTIPISQNTSVLCKSMYRPRSSTTHSSEPGLLWLPASRSWIRFYPC